MNVFRVIRPPDIFTLLNLVFGFMAILFAGRAAGGSSTQYALVFILLAAMADGLDGLVARKMGGSPLGANLDSLADLVSFGLAPPFLAISAFHLPPHIWPAAIFFLLCGALRLARFNIVSAKSDQHFEGLPIPAAGLALSASVLLGRPHIDHPAHAFSGPAHDQQHSLPQDQRSAAYDPFQRRLHSGGCGPLVAP